MRMIFLLLALACVGVGVLFGALNPHAVNIDFYWLQVEASLGAAFLVSALIGMLLGGMAVSVGVVWPLRRRLRKAQREARGQRDSRVTPAEASEMVALNAETR
mgnify:CR=1 FL=1